MPQTGGNIVATPISALEHRPSDFIREVSPEAISFYVDGLSGLYLPEDFKEKHADLHDVKRWRPEDRLRGKFGRFTLKHEEEGQEEIGDILVMGTTIGLTGLDLYGRGLKRLRHHALQYVIGDVLEKRGLLGEPVSIERADYGNTGIVVRDRGCAEAVRVSGSSFDFGRANAEGRQQTCESFERLLGETVQVINVDPEPRPSERIVEP